MGEGMENNNKNVGVRSTDHEAAASAAAAAAAAAMDDVN